MPRVRQPDARTLRLTPHALVLRRGGDTLQIGLEPSLVLPGSYARVVDALGTGATPRRLETIARADRLPTGASRDLVAALQAHRMLEPDDGAGRMACVRVAGTGPLGARVASELATAGVGTVYLADLPERDPAPSRSPDEARSTPRRADVVAATLAESHPTVRIRAFSHFAKPDGAAALTVVVADGPEPDRLVSDHLLQHGQPHLLVRCSGDEVVVGPLVVPGTTSCVRCSDLARRDADPGWPWLLDQLTRIHLLPDASLTSWAAVTAVTQVLGFLEGGEPETLGHTLELRADDHTMRLRAWPAHDECGCGAVQEHVGPDELWSDRGE